MSISKGTAQVEQSKDKVKRLRWFGRADDYTGQRMLNMALPGQRKRGRLQRCFSDLVRGVPTRTWELCKNKLQKSWGQYKICPIFSYMSVTEYIDSTTQAGNKTRCIYLPLSVSAHICTCAHVIVWKKNLQMINQTPVLM